MFPATQNAAATETVNITKDTIWKDYKSVENQVVNVQPGATLTIAGNVFFEKSKPSYPTQLNVMEGAAVEVISGGNLWFTDDAKFILQSGGIVNVNGGDTIISTRYTNGVPGNLVIENGGVFNVNSGGVLSGEGRTWNHGLLTINSGGSLILGGPASLLDTDGQTDINDGGKVSVGGILAVSNHGIFFVRQGAHIGHIARMEINGGRLNVLEGFNFDGRVEVKYNGFIGIDSGTHPVVIKNTGFLSIGSGDSTIEIFPGANLEVEPGGQLATYGGVLDLHSGATLNDAGLVTSVTGGNTLEDTFRIKGIFNVNSGGVILTKGGEFNIGEGGIVNVNNGGMLHVAGIPAPPSDERIDPLSGGIGSKLEVNSGGMINVVSGSSSPISPRSAGIINVTDGGTITVNPSGIIKLNGRIGPTFIPGLLTVNSDSILDIKPDGLVDLYGKLVIKRAAGLFNNGTINKQCSGKLSAENGSFVVGNPVSNVCIAFPVTHMSDTTASRGIKIGDGVTLGAGEFVTPTSQLIGDKIDQITLKLRKFGSPTGSATIGVFDSNGLQKKQFATLDVSTLTTSFSDYDFKLTGGQLYTIANGDRIGIRYSGTASSTTSGIMVMSDTDIADPFDGTLTQGQRLLPGTAAGTGTWTGKNTMDLYMILRQNHG